jgi:TetR/AcrR family transcriptional regulator, mexJK operon transcriptional repressor
MPKSLSKKTSSKKRESIIKSALSAFLELGYSGTTMDEVVKRAGGSKASIYKHFKNKEDLFATVVDEMVRYRLPDELNLDDPPKQALLEYAESRLQVVFTRKHVALRRLIIGEGARISKIARMYYEHGPGLSITQLEKYLQAENARGSLKVKDPHASAAMFIGMLIHNMYLRSLFSVSAVPSTAQMKAQAKKVVDTFLVAHKA